MDSSAAVNKMQSMMQSVIAKVPLLGFKADLPHGIFDLNEAVKKFGTKEAGKHKVTMLDVDLTGTKFGTDPSKKIVVRIGRPNYTEESKSKVSTVSLMKNSFVNDHKTSSKNLEVENTKAVPSEATWRTKRGITGLPGDDLPVVTFDEVPPKFSVQLWDQTDTTVQPEIKVPLHEKNGLFTTSSPQTVNLKKTLEIPSLTEKRVNWTITELELRAHWHVPVVIGGWFQVMYSVPFAPHKSEVVMYRPFHAADDNNFLAANHHDLIFHATGDFKGKCVNTYDLDTYDFDLATATPVGAAAGGLATSFAEHTTGEQGGANTVPASRPDSEARAHAVVRVTHSQACIHGMD